MKAETNNQNWTDLDGRMKDFANKVNSSKKERIKKDIKQQDWSDFDKLINDFGNSPDSLPEKKVKDEIKSRILGNEVMTDSQHRYIIALFTNELCWPANSAFKFVLKTIPQLRGRLKGRTLRETEIQGLYRELKKNEASKLINILKSISGREKQNKSKIKS